MKFPDAIYRRDFLHRQAIRRKDPILVRKYKESKYHVKKLIVKTKRNYYYQQISSSNNPKKLWNTLKTVLPSKQCNNHIPIDLSSDIFNNYFSSIGTKLNSNFNNSSDMHCGTPCPNPPNQSDTKLCQNFNFYQLPTQFVFDKLNNFKDSCSFDILNMDTKLLKLSAALIAPSLTHIYNLSLYQGIVPKDFKKARVTPIYKKGDPHVPSNYRPISVTSHLGKILEQAVKHQLVTHLINGKLLSPNQFAYIKVKSTQTALHNIIDSWLSNIEKGDITGACFLDLTKCFDSVSHDILLNKLENYGINNTELQWFRSYLTNRTQIVKCHGSLSKPNLLSTGIPQGTILGPCLCILYANDLFNCLSTGNCIMYADDITIYCTGKTIADVQSKLQQCVNNSLSWLHQNKLMINPSKSSSMLIGTKQKIENLTLNIQINNCTIDYVNHFKLLGVTIDSNLTWNIQTTNVCKKISSRIGLIRRLKMYYQAILYIIYIIL